MKTRHSPKYKLLLESILPLVVATTGDQKALLADVESQLKQARENQKARQAEDYRRDPEKYKARARKQPNPSPEKRRAQYQNSLTHRRAKGREYAAKRRENGKQQAYAETLKSDGRSRMYQARYKYGEFAEAALILDDIEKRLKSEKRETTNV